MSENWPKPWSGRRVLLHVDKSPAKPGEVVLDVKNVTWKDRKGIARVDNVSFNVRKGEIVGIAGVSGNGQSELLDCIAASRGPPRARSFSKARTLAIWATRRHLRGEGLAHVPEDRQHRGLITTFDACEILPSSAGTTMKAWGMVSGLTVAR